MSVFASPAAARRRARAVLAHEDPAFMRTQWKPTLAFLDRVFRM